MTDNRLFEAALGSPLIPLLKRRLKGEPFLSLNSVADAGKPFVVALLSQISNRPVLVVTDGLKSQEAFFNDLQTFLPDAQFYPAWETLPHENKLPHADTIADRLRALNELVTFRSAERDKPGVLVASVQALMQRTFAPRYFQQLRRELRVGQTLELDSLTSVLTHLGYHPEYQVNERGDMAMRGGLVDFYPLDCNYPVRVEFLGDRLESIRSFDPISQQSLEQLEAIALTPAGELGILKQWPDNASPLVDVLARDTLLVLDEPAKLAESAEAYALQIPAEEKLFVPWEHTLRSPFTRVQLTEEIALDPPPTHINLRLVSLDAFRPLETRAPEPEVAEQMRRAFFEQMQRWMDEGFALFVYCNNEGEQQRFEELWQEYGFEEKAGMLPQIGSLSRGLLWPEAKIGVITDAEIFGRYKLARPRRKFHATAQVSDWAETLEGDFVVHIQHGIGKYLGLKQLEFSGAKQEVLAIEYADEARLYVPVDQAHLVSKYIGAGKRAPQLHQLGGTLWERQKFSAERSIMDLASGLLEIQAARNSLQGHQFKADTSWQYEFEAAFIYEETPDQVTSIEEVKRDMESGKPMDRLICGDVGYGKTEVAIRASFKAVMDGMQVAVLVPTTVLAEQHFNTFRERMAGYPIRVEMLSRFRTPREQKKVVTLLREGAVDVVIGTHRLLSPDVLFKNLGIVVIDEEQRFGVLHKERFKQLRKLVDVLTLSATPIPRTLYMALTGARDMSTIETPPHDRLPVETIVTAYDERLIKTAIQREINRGGQVYFLHNRVQSIDAVADRLRQMFEDNSVRIDVGHGQMNEHELELVMHRFVNGQIDVLVCTTIIESGLDIPNANTIIIDRADRFGLSDLYQLRGRVGRYKHQAYAYILLPRHLQLVQSARKRISAIKQYSSLGSGFKIAMRDLEIRGAGNILGAEQSGHITAIGFDLYCQLLKESIARLKGERVKRHPRVTLKLDYLNDESGEPLARIPVSYIKANRLRIGAYRKIAQVAELSDIESIRAELRDRYGKFPDEVDLLLDCAELRILAADARVDMIETREDKIMLSQGTQLFQVSGKFPRFTATVPKGKLREIKKLLKSLH